MLRIRDLEVEKAGAAICRVANLDVDRGQRIAIVGPNGSGKTTLLRVLSGLEENFQGECQVEAPKRHRVFVHQAPYLFRGSVTWNVSYGLAARKIARKDRIRKALHWLKILGVDHLADRRCSKLSGGERRRVALARAFAIGAELILLDEPLADLDEQGIEIVCRAIADVSDSTVLIASPVPLPALLAAQSYSFKSPASQ